MNWRGVWVLGCVLVSVREIFIISYVCSHTLSHYPPLSSHLANHTLFYIGVPGHLHLSRVSHTRCLSEFCRVSGGGANCEQNRSRTGGPSERVESNGRQGNKVATDETPPHT